MAFTKLAVPRRWAKEAARCQARSDKVQFLNDQKTVEARQQLKAMRTITFHSAAPSAGEFWDPKGKNKAKGSSGKCERINRGHRAKLNQAKGL